MILCKLLCNLRIDASDDAISCKVKKNHFVILCKLLCNLRIDASDDANSCKVKKNHFVILCKLRCIWEWMRLTTPFPI